MLRHWNNDIHVYLNGLKSLPTWERYPPFRLLIFLNSLRELSLRSERAGGHRQRTLSSPSSSHRGAMPSIPCSSSSFAGILKKQIGTLSSPLESHSISTLVATGTRKYTNTNYR